MALRAAPAAPADPDPVPAPSPLLLLRGALGGTLMGLANLVPGISGGTMLLATGVYPGFIAAVAELTRLRLRPRSLFLVGVIAATAATGILVLAAPTKDLVVAQRWVMYSLFVGLTLGGVPLVWRLAQPATPGVWIGAAAAFGLMSAMALIKTPGTEGGEASTPLLLLSGAAGAGAMILPGVSGGYLLLLLGQYLPILGAIDRLKQGLLGGAVDLTVVGEALEVVVPVGLGVVAGVVAVSNLLQWLLRRFEKPTLGALLGLLVGAVVGLWPFQQGLPPQPGDLVRGERVTAEAASGIDPEHWAVGTFRPRSDQAAGAVALAGAGLLTTLLIGRLGRDTEERGAAPAQSG